MKVRCHCDFIPFSQESRYVCNGEGYALYLNVCAKNKAKCKRYVCMDTHIHTYIHRHRLMHRCEQSFKSIKEQNEMYLFLGYPLRHDKCKNNFISIAVDASSCIHFKKNHYHQLYLILE